MSIVKIDELRCKSCSLCVVACPKNALSLGTKAIKTGYAPIMINREKCIGCGICFDVCPDLVFELIEEEEEVNG